MKKPTLLVIFLTVFIDLIGFGIVLPLLPQYSEQFGAEGWEIGFIIASFSLMQFVFSPVWGRLSDRIGRRPVLLVSTAGSVVSYAMFAMSAYMSGTAGLMVLLGSRLFAGVCGANISVASAYIADITTAENRSKGMGLIGMSFGLGFILGPAISALSAQTLGPAGPGWIATGLCAANFVLACFILVESRVPGAGSSSDRPRMAQWMHTLAQPRLGLLIGLHFLSTFCFACFESTLPLMVGSAVLHPSDIKDPAALLVRLRDGRDQVTMRIRAQMSPEFIPVISAVDGKITHALRGRLVDELNRVMKSADMFDERALRGVKLGEGTRRVLGKKAARDEIVYRNRLVLEDAWPGEVDRLGYYFDKSHIGYLFAYCGLVSAFIQGGAIGRLVRRFGEARLIAGSLVVVGASSVLMTWTPSLGILLLASGLFSAASGLTRAPVMALISIFAPAAEQGGTLGVAQSAATLARVIGPVLATTLFYGHEAWPFGLCAVLAAGAAWVGWRRLVAGQPRHLHRPLGAQG
jgi:MFS family permease